jgi:hypothetical protein
VTGYRYRAPMCRRCERRREDVHPCRRKGGGNYRRPHRWYSSSLCVPCARELAEHITPSTMTVSQWSVSGVRSLAACRTVEEARAGMVATLADTQRGDVDCAACRPDLHDLCGDDTTTHDRRCRTNRQEDTTP